VRAVLRGLESEGGPTGDDPTHRDERDYIPALLKPQLGAPGHRMVRTELIDFYKTREFEHRGRWNGEEEENQSEAHVLFRRGPVLERELLPL
jgi:hypothetical protein